MSLPYYKRYPRDLIEGTIGMPLELKGAYGLVLDLIYMQDGQLPDDARYISGLLGCTVRKWKHIREALISRRKLYVNGELLSNYRADNECETRRKFQDNQAEKARGSRKNNDLPHTTARPARVKPEPDTERDSNTIIELGNRARTPREELETVLDSERSEAVIEHRQRIRKPLTAHAARLLAGKFAKCQDPNSAADAMVANGWQGFEPQWLENRAHSPPRQHPNEDIIGAFANYGGRE